MVHLNKSVLMRSCMILFAAVATMLTQSCDDSKSYAELLAEENSSVNRFLAYQRVVSELPADNKFITGEDAPYYPLDNEGNLYMQVISVGTGEMAEDNQLIYFRFTRYALAYYSSGEEMEGEGNSENPEYGNMAFRYGNYTLSSSSQWGTGIQEPLKYLPIGSEIRLIVKSQWGWTSEISNVQPFLYHIRYYSSQI